MIILQILEDLGLQDKEPEVYLALLRLPGPQPASILAQKTALNRTTVYKTLLRLAQKGLVTKTMRFGITCFFAEEPDRSLEGLLQKERESLEGLHQQLLHLLPEIKQMQRQELVTPRVRFYEGLEGVKRVYEDTLVEKKPIDAFENVAHMAPEVNDYIFNRYIPRRVENEIFARVITPKNPDNVRFRKKDKTQCRETRFAAIQNFPMEIEINVYGQKTAFFSYKTEEMFGTILESPAIANSMRAIFEYCWETAR